MTIAELKEKNITELTKIARTLDLPGASGMRKQDLIFKILQAQSEKEGHIFAEGSLKFCPTAMAFCAPPITTTSWTDDIYVSPSRSANLASRPAAPSAARCVLHTRARSISRW